MNDNNNNNKKGVCYFPGQQQNADSHIHCIRHFQLNWSGKTVLIDQDVNEKVNESKPSGMSR